MRIRMLAAIAAIAFIGATSAADACAALKGTTSWDSVFKTYGDPFFGGSWSNSQNGSASIQRQLASPAKITGFYMRYAGSDITARGSRILVKAKLTSNGTWITLLDLRETLIGRDVSSSVAPTRMGPATVTMQETEVSALRVEMTGNGWFAMDQTMFFVRGCSSYSG